MAELVTETPQTLWPVTVAVLTVEQLVEAR